MSLEDYMEVQHNNFEASSASKSGSNSSKSKLPTKYPYRFSKDFILLNTHTVLDIHQKCLIGQKLSIFSSCMFITGLLIICTEPIYCNGSGLATWKISRNRFERAVGNPFFTRSSPTAASLRKKPLRCCLVPTALNKRAHFIKEEGNKS